MHYTYGQYAQMIYPYYTSPVHAFAEHGAPALAAARLDLLLSQSLALRAPLLFLAVPLTNPRSLVGVSPLALLLPEVSQAAALPFPVVVELAPPRLPCVAWVAHLPLVAAA
ncbi:hypothetical protein ARSEF1564_009126 [Beauveria bassiana]